jgi:hypothetical protein
MDMTTDLALALDTACLFTVLGLTDDTWQRHVLHRPTALCYSIATQQAGKSRVTAITAGHTALSTLSASVSIVVPTQRPVGAACRTWPAPRRTGRRPLRANLRRCRRLRGGWHETMKRPPFY